MIDTIPQSLSACEYLTWAYYHDINLQFAYTQTDVNTCESLAVTYYNYVLDVDEKLGYLGANQFLKKLLDQLRSITG